MAITESADPRKAPSRSWLVRLAWLVALWSAGVATLGLAAWLLRLAMHAVGFS